MNRRPTDPDFWNVRYESGRTPWDFGGVPAALRSFLAAQPGAGRRALIPGCGSGREIAAFAAAGWDVTAIDFSPVAVAQARARLAPTLAGRVVLGDFFTHPFAAAPFDLIYERTFLCALPATEWPRIVMRTAALLKPDGVLTGFYFFSGKEDGPPFGLAPGEAEMLFSQTFTLIRDEPAADSLSLFAGKERWQERRRRPSG